MDGRYQDFGKEPNDVVIRQQLDERAVHLGQPALGYCHPHRTLTEDHGFRSNTTMKAIRVKAKKEARKTKVSSYVMAALARVAEELNSAQAEFEYRKQLKRETSSETQALESEILDEMAEALLPSELERLLSRDMDAMEKVHAATAAQSSGRPPSRVEAWTGHSTEHKPPACPATACSTKSYKPTKVALPAVLAKKKPQKLWSYFVSAPWLMPEDANVVIRPIKDADATAKEAAMPKTQHQGKAGNKHRGERESWAQVLKQRRREAYMQRLTDIYLANKDRLNEAHAARLIQRAWRQHHELQQAASLQKFTELQAAGLLEPLAAAEEDQGEEEVEEEEEGLEAEASLGSVAQQAWKRNVVRTFLKQPSSIKVGFNTSFSPRRQPSFVSPTSPMRPSRFSLSGNRISLCGNRISQPGNRISMSGAKQQYGKPPSVSLLGAVTFMEGEDGPARTPGSRSRSRFSPNGKAQRSPTAGSGFEFQGSLSEDGAEQDQQPVQDGSEEGLGDGGFGQKGLQGDQRSDNDQQEETLPTQSAQHNKSKKQVPATDRHSVFERLAKKDGQKTERHFTSGKEKAIYASKAEQAAAARFAHMQGSSSHADPVILHGGQGDGGGRVGTAEVVLIRSFAAGHPGEAMEQQEAARHLQQQQLDAGSAAAGGALPAPLTLNALLSGKQGQRGHTSLTRAQPGVTLDTLLSMVSAAQQGDGHSGSKGSGQIHSGISNHGRSSGFLNHGEEGQPSYDLDALGIGVPKGSSKPVPKVRPGHILHFSRSKSKSQHSNRSHGGVTASHQAGVAPAAGTAAPLFSVRSVFQHQSGDASSNDPAASLQGGSQVEAVAAATTSDNDESQDGEGPDVTLLVEALAGYLPKKQGHKEKLEAVRARWAAKPSLQPHADFGDTVIGGRGITAAGGVDHAARISLCGDGRIRIPAATTVAKRGKVRVALRSRFGDVTHPMLEHVPMCMRVQELASSCSSSVQHAARMPSASEELPVIPEQPDSKALGQLTASSGFPGKSAPQPMHRPLGFVTGKSVMAAPPDSTKAAPKNAGKPVGSSVGLTMGVELHQQQLAAKPPLWQQQQQQEEVMPCPGSVERALLSASGAITAAITAIAAVIPGLQRQDQQAVQQQVQDAASPKATLSTQARLLAQSNPSAGFRWITKEDFRKALQHPHSALDVPHTETPAFVPHLLQKGGHLSQHATASSNSKSQCKTDSPHSQGHTSRHLPPLLVPPLGSASGNHQPTTSQQPVVTETSGLQIHKTHPLPTLKGPAAHTEAAETTMVKPGFTVDQHAGMNMHHHSGMHMHGDTGMHTHQHAGMHMHGDAASGGSGQSSSSSNAAADMEAYPTRNKKQPCQSSACASGTVSRHSNQTLVSESDREVLLGLSDYGRAMYVPLSGDKKGSRIHMLKRSAASMRLLGVSSVAGKSSTGSSKTRRHSVCAPGSLPVLAARTASNARLQGQGSFSSWAKEGADPEQDLPGDPSFESFPATQPLATSAVFRGRSDQKDKVNLACHSEDASCSQHRGMPNAAVSGSTKAGMPAGSCVKLPRLFAA